MARVHVIRKQTNAQGILAQLERHLSLLRRRRKGYPARLIATYTDRQEILTYAQVAAMLSEIEHTSDGCVQVE